MSNKNQQSINLTHSGWNVRVVLDRKGVAYPIWGSAVPDGPLARFFWAKNKSPHGKLPTPDVRKSFLPAFEKAARKLGAKGIATI